jgi:hypothetical protein
MITDVVDLEGVERSTCREGVSRYCGVTHIDIHV